MDLRIKTVADGLDAFQKVYKQAIRRKVNIRVAELAETARIVSEQILTKWQDTWCELGLTDINSIGRVLSMQFGPLASKFCCDRYGIGAVTTEALAIFYEMVQYYINALDQSERSIADKIQRTILQEYEFNGLSADDLHTLKAIIVYSVYANIFETYDLQGRNIIEQCTEPYRISSDELAEVITVQPVWHIQNSGSIICTDQPLLTNTMFTYYFTCNYKDCYVYKPVQYRSQRVKQLCNKILCKDGKVVDDALLQQALFYLGVSVDTIGKYTETVCNSAIQHYNGIMHAPLQKYLRKNNKDFYKDFYIDNVCKHVRAHLGSVADSLKTVPNLKILYITDKQVVFSVNKGTDLKTCLPADIHCDVTLIQPFSAALLETYYLS